jgi:uncharacterized protein YcaQ
MDKLIRTLESIVELANEEMGEWQSVEWGFLPTRLSNLYYIRQAAQSAIDEWTQEQPAAPELLEACRALLETTAANLDDQEPADIAVYATARAAIAKAEGKQP